MTEPQQGPTYRVVRNDEEQYSLWATGRELPAGWYEEGTTGSEQECLDHIAVIWTDMRPRSIREGHAGIGGARS